MTTNPEDIDRTVREHYRRVWESEDAWELDSSEYESRRLDALVAIVSDRIHDNVVEIGCGAGALTGRLEACAGRILAIDVADSAIERARRTLGEHGRHGRVEFQTANAMHHDFAASGPWDLIVLAETIYCLGWLYSAFDVGLFARGLAESLAPGGRLLLSNTFGQPKDWLMMPCLILTYRDLFLNCGLERERESTFEAVKNGVEFRVLSTLFRRPADGTLAGIPVEPRTTAG